MKRLALVLLCGSGFAAGMPSETEKLLGKWYCTAQVRVADEGVAQNELWQTLLAEMHTRFETELFADGRFRSAGANHLAGERAMTFVSSGKWWLDGDVFANEVWSGKQWRNGSLHHQTTEPERKPDMRLVFSDGKIWRMENKDNSVFRVTVQCRRNKTV